MKNVCSLYVTNKSFRKPHSHGVLAQWYGTTLNLPHLETFGYVLLHTPYGTRKVDHASRYAPMVIVRKRSRAISAACARCSLPPTTLSSSWSAPCASRAAIAACGERFPIRFGEGTIVTLRCGDMSRLAALSSDGRRCAAGGTSRILTSGDPGLSPLEVSSSMYDSMRTGVSVAGIESTWLVWHVRMARSRSLPSLRADVDAELGDMCNECRASMSSCAVLSFLPSLLWNPLNDALIGEPLLRLASRTSGQQQQQQVAALHARRNRKRVRSESAQMMSMRAMAMALRSSGSSSNHDAGRSGQS